MKILAIETSCDETCAAIVEKSNQEIRVLSNTVASQVAIHAKTGGVVPEVASREHIKQMIPVVNQALNDANTLLKDVDAIAVTTGPGLLPALLIGVETARALAASTAKPVISVNHIEGHIGVNILEDAKTLFPAIALVVSGGHTELILVSAWGEYRKLGATRDDASGEAFDKVARMLGLPYPGGPEISRVATNGNPSAFDFPRPMMHDTLDMSFSGLKTAVRYEVEEHKDQLENPQYIADIAASFQQAVADVLVSKTTRAVQQTGAQTVLLAGGVAANILLRDQLEKACLLENIAFIKPRLSYCTDNAVMIGVAALLKGEQGFKDWKTVKADANWELVS